MDSYWEKIKRGFQYWLEEVFDWAAYLEYLQMILQEINLAVILNKQILIQYFWKSLRPSIQAQLDPRGWKLDF